ncbi:MAG: fatty acid hydroxylase, partial [Sphingomonadales bacterium]|nr:fatty acid hydroxylase [Sphingomonadales bacterium]
MVLSIYMAFGLLELFRTRLFSKNEQTRNDGIVEVISTVLLLVFTQPAILIFVDYALGALRP